MSDPFIPRQVPLMNPVKARDIARTFAALADQMESAEYPEEADAMRRRADWWLAYSTNLAALPPGRVA